MKIKVGTVIRATDGTFGPVDAVLSYADRTEYEVAGTRVTQSDIEGVYRKVEPRAAKPRKPKEAKSAKRAA